MLKVPRVTSGKSKVSKTHPAGWYKRCRSVRDSQRQPPSKEREQWHQAGRTGGCCLAHTTNGSCLVNEIGNRNSLGEIEELNLVKRLESTVQHIGYTVL